MSAREFAVTWGRRFFDEIEVANHDRFLNLYDCEAKTLVETLQPWVTNPDPVPYCEMLKRYWSTAPLQPEAHDVVARIDLPVCCVSNADTADIMAAIERHDLPLDRVVTSEDARCYKPDPKIFAVALDQMGVDPTRVLHVGDSLHSDVGGAEKLGITTVWVCREDRIFDAGECSPDHKIFSLNELDAILAGGQ
jgi:2-haloacid dehalogenase/putative hydrolase of the HAD superfamily